MEVKASLKGYRISAQKARLVVDQVRGRGVEEAINLLEEMQEVKPTAPPPPEPDQGQLFP